MKALVRENERLRCRIKQLENIICPAEQHDFVVVSEWYESIDFGTVTDAELHRKLMCKRCFTEKVVTIF